MAATKQPADALLYVKSFLKRMPLEDIGPQLLETVSTIIWMSSPWRWTVGSLAATSLTSNTQDYTITAPADFLNLLDGFIADGAGVYRPLHMDSSLPTDVKVVGNPARIAYQGSNTFRVFPKPGIIPSSPAQQLILRYKKNPPTIDNQTQYTAGRLVMDDAWFWVYEEGVLWKAYQWGDDNRAGSVTIDSQGRAQYTGQLAVFRDALRQMAEREKLSLMDPFFGQNPTEVNK